MVARALVVGRGGREAALAFALSQTPGVEVFVLPGNPGVEAFAQPLPGWREEEALAWVRKNPVELVVIGPEAPLAAGLADALREAGAVVFGPSAAATRVESSKLFAKELMRKAHVPTLAPTLLSSPHDAANAAAVAGTVVLKADGLRQGKGVVIATGPDEAAKAFAELASPGGAVYAEPFRQGREVSLFAVAAGERLRLLPAARDHKRAFDGDRGPNTGGMGAVCPVLSAQHAEELGERVVRPVLKALAEEGSPFVGCLFAGLLLTEEGPLVLEFNARFGDPEAEVILPLMATGSLYPLLLAAATDTLRDGPVLPATGFAAGVVLASEGYPSAPRTGAPLQGLEPVVQEGALVFWAGVERGPDGRVRSAGGRVACVVGVGETPAGAVARAYARVGEISSEGLFWRHDIRFRPEEDMAGRAAHAPRTEPSSPA